MREWTDAWRTFASWTKAKQSRDMRNKWRADLFQPWRLIPGQWPWEMNTGKERDPENCPAGNEMWPGVRACPLPSLLSAVWGQTNGPGRDSCHPFVHPTPNPRNWPGSQLEPRVAISAATFPPGGSLLGFLQPQAAARASRRNK